MADGKVSKILEISDLIVFNLFSGLAGVPPSLHYWPYCANETILHSLVLTSFLGLIFVFLLSFADLGHRVATINLGRTIERYRWIQT